MFNESCPLILFAKCLCFYCETVLFVGLKIGQFPRKHQVTLKKLKSNLTLK